MKLGLVLKNWVALPVRQNAPDRIVGMIDDTASGIERS